MKPFEPYDPDKQPEPEEGWVGMPALHEVDPNDYDQMTREIMKSIVEKRRYESAN
jgi:RNA:NAD 2'-phosphotransferase (TPT1/KptA family)